MPRKQNPDQVDMDNFHFDDGEDEKSDDQLLDEWNTEGLDDDVPKKAEEPDEAPPEKDDKTGESDEEWDEDDEDEDEDEWDEDEEDDEDDES